MKYPADHSAVIDTRLTTKMWKQFLNRPPLQIVQPKQVRHASSPPGELESNAPWSTQWVQNLMLWIELKFYPILLLVYAYGLGALKAGNFDLLFRWFVQTVRREQSGSQPLIVSIGNWWSTTHNYWKLLDGKDRAKTPLSDHLHTVTSAWASDYALGSKPNHFIEPTRWSVIQALKHRGLEHVARILVG
jgi:hypothetical protein